MSTIPEQGLAAATDGAGAIIDTARRLGQVDAGPIELDPSKLYGHVTTGDRGEVALEIVDLERWRPHPDRADGERTFFTAAAFSAYVTRHRTDAATIWADAETRRVVAVLDDHTPERAGWRRHTATLELRATLPWRRWAERDGVLGPQEDFANHIETGLGEIVEPDGAQLLEIAQSFHATSSHLFRSDTRLTSGQVQFRHEEQIEASAGRAGELTVPTEFTLALTPFEGAEAFRVTARLRYRLRDGKLAIGYVLDRPEDVLHEAVRDTTRAVQDATGIPVWEGRP